MKRLLIAAGGGGDAITAAMIHTALHGHGAPALILTYAWERLTVDPVPGPRSLTDFTHTRHAGPSLRLITPDSRPIPPAGSLLPRLAADLQPELGLLDPHQGTTGLAAQIRQAADYCEAARIELVDVGGDILTDGTEPTLRSPLGDALALAACAHADIPTTVHLAGPGLDSEIPLPDLMKRLGRPAYRLALSDTRCVDAVFDWHPSEASALLVAAARGIRGLCGTRDTPRPVRLDENSAGVHRIPLSHALELNPLARALATTQTLTEAEEASRLVCGFSEIERERLRAQRTVHRHEHPAQSTNPNTPPNVLERFLMWEQKTARDGINYVTTRRIAEEMSLTPSELSHLKAELSLAVIKRHVPPLWEIVPGNSGMP